MQLKFTDLDANHLIRILGSNGFGLDLAYDAREELLAATIWTENNYEGSDGPCGFMCGQITRQPTASFPRFDLVIDDGRVNRARVHGLMTDLLNQSWRA